MTGRITPSVIYWTLHLFAGVRAIIPPFGLHFDFEAVLPTNTCFSHTHNVILVRSRFTEPKATPYNILPSACPDHGRRRPVWTALFVSLRLRTKQPKTWCGRNDYTFLLAVLCP